jgi:hypothetical protein
MGILAFSFIDYGRILYSSSCYRRILWYRRILLVVSTGG